MAARRTRADWEAECDRALQEAVGKRRDWAEVRLTRGKATMVDLADLPQVRESGLWYALRSGRGVWRVVRHVSVGSKSSAETLSRYLLGAREGEQVDHRNHDSLDNRRDNLRLCTPGENLANRRKWDHCSSRYKGVHWDRRRGMWKVEIRYQDTKRHLGYFDSEEEAASAYNAAAIDVWGEFAYINAGLPGVPAIREVCDE